MSINVNVSGNPVSIKRGKYCVADPDYAQKEFQKRRRIRLEQVRQQSKDIAESVRNKVRNEKSKRLSNLEKQGEKELQKWQARKLLALQKQYQECLKDIGLGHMQANLEEESNQAMELRKENYDQIANERGELAFKKLRDMNQEELANKSAFFQKKRDNQNIEKTRSKLVANLNKKKYSPFKRKKRKNVNTDINITSRLTGGSASESDLVELNLSRSDSSSASSTSSKSEEYTQYTTTTVHSPSKNFSRNYSEERKKTFEYISSPPRREHPHKKTIASYPVDTRISDRIKRRAFANNHHQPTRNICDNTPDDNVQNKTSSGSFQSSVNHSHRKHSPVVNTVLKSDERPKCVAVTRDGPVSKSSTRKETREQVPKKEIREEVSTKEASEQIEIPTKPTVALRKTSRASDPSQSKSGQMGATATATSITNKVQYYDHKNRYFKQYIPDNSSVRKIDEESIEICVSTGSEADYMEKLHKWDEEAQVRGRKAMEKEKIHQDYRKMLQQLPILQKQERIASIPIHKAKFHMLQDRLKELEIKKQNRMENCYEKLFPKRNVITIPPKTQSKVPVNTQTIDYNSPVLNVASWDFNTNKESFPVVVPKNVDFELIRETMKHIPPGMSNLESVSERRDYLQEMLDGILQQRNKLVNELSRLPENSHLRKLYADLANIDGLIQVGRITAYSNSKKRGKKETDRKSRASSSGSSPSSRHSSKSPQRKKDQDKISKSKYHTHCVPSDPSTSPKTRRSPTKKRPRKSKKSPPQNISTQTTPLLEKQEVASKVQDVHDQEVQAAICDKPGPCVCCKDAKASCEIIITIADNGRPQICLSPTKLKDKKIIVKTADSKESVASVQIESQIEKPEHTEPDKIIIHEKLKTRALGKQKLNDRTVQPKQLDKKYCICGTKPAEKQSDQKDCTCSVSWREYLSHNSGDSSTSYFSPPEFTHAKQPSQGFSLIDKTDQMGAKQKTGHFTGILKDKPQQNNMQSDPNRPRDTTLLQYIQTLLVMSRANVDTLGVSSASEVSTPGSSIINMTSNRSNSQFYNVMKQLNISMTDIGHCLSCSSDANSANFNSSPSPLSSTRADFKDLESANFNFNSLQQTRQHDMRSLSLDQYSSQNYPGVLNAYNNLAENCVKRIENLAAMIEKVRLDKLTMLKSPDSGSDKENSTRYLEVPSKFKSPTPEQQQTQPDRESSSSGSLTEQDDFHEQFFEIDISFAEKLKKMTPEEIREKYPLSASSSSTDANEVNADQQDNIDDDLATRYKHLLGIQEPRDQVNFAQTPRVNVSTSFDSGQVSKNKDIQFEPLLSGIPRLPAYTGTNIGQHTSSCKCNNKSKPPTSKGLTIAKRFNNNIDIVPHELSTIPEIDSSKATISKTSESKDLIDKDLVPIVILNSNDIIATDDFKPVTPSSSDSLPDILTELMKDSAMELPDKLEMPKQPVTPASGEFISDSSASELENMEAMLKSLGMGWAIATLRKTQEALALTSSSSSIDVSIKQRDLKLSDSNSTSESSIKDILGKQFLTKLSSSSSNSSVDVSIKQKDPKFSESSTTREISIKNILGKQFLTKLSSSSSKTDDSSSASPFTRELQDISAIQGSGTSYEKTTHRTSTPVHSSKTDDKSKNESQPQVILSGESELSSVRTHSDDNCDQVPFYSLNDESSIKSKNGTKSN